MYKITIERHEDVDYTTREWQKLTDNVEAKDQYGYAPPITATKTERTEIFTQTVAELDIAAVIKAINKI